MHYDLIIRHAHLHRSQELVDIAVHDGHFAKIVPAISDSSAREINAAGRLVSPPFIDAHVHLDAVLTMGQPRYSSTGNAAHPQPRGRMRCESDSPACFDRGT